MHIKPRLLLFILIVADIAFATAVLTFKMLSLIATFLVFACFLVLAIFAYDGFYLLENRKIQDKVLQSLQLNYSEVIPIHPLLIAIQCHVPFKKDVKVYAKVCYGYNVHVKFVSSKGASTIVTTDYLWFYTNFKEKESN